MKQMALEVNALTTGQNYKFYMSKSYFLMFVLCMRKYNDGEKNMMELHVFSTLEYEIVDSGKQFVFVCLQGWIHH
jgi:hypothetical protein